MPIEVSPAFSPSNYVSMIWGRLWYWHSRQINKAEEAYRAYRIGQDIATVRKNTVWSDVFHLASFYSFCFATAVQAFLNLPQLRFTYFFIDSFPCFISVSFIAFFPLLWCVHFRWRRMVCFLMIVNWLPTHTTNFASNFADGITATITRAGIKHVTYAYKKLSL